MGAETFEHDHPIRQEIARVYAWEQAAWAGAAAGTLTKDEHNQVRRDLDIYKGQLIQRLKCRDVSAYVDARLRYAPVSS